MLQCLTDGSDAHAELFGKTGSPADTARRPFAISNLPANQIDRLLIAPEAEPMVAATKPVPPPAGRCPIPTGHAGRIVVLSTGPL